MNGMNLGEAVDRLAAFLSAAPLTTVIADLERKLEGKERSEIERVVRSQAVDDSLLEAAITVRRDLGRINYLIHAAAILLVVPKLMDADEMVTNRPSLAAGNDPTRPYDIETNQRVAEFKLSRWLGADAMRKRQTFKDLVHLAVDESGREPQLLVVGEAPIRFLRSSRATASWALDRSPGTRQLFASRFGSLQVSVADFTAGPGARVVITDITELLPRVANLSQPPVVTQPTDAATNT